MGQYRINKINIDICQLHVDEWSNKLKKYRTVKSYASKVIDYAIKRGYLQTNPFKLIDMPRCLKEEIDQSANKEENFYTRDQLIKFLNYLEQENNVKVFAFFRLLAFSGMRKGEALALQWNDIDFKNNDITINKAISRGKGNKLYLKTTKTRLNRIIKMDEKTMKILQDWKKKQKQDNLILGYNTLQPKQLVFSNEKNEYLQPTKTRKWLLQVQEKYNLKKITTHGLRHTHCSLLFEAGASIKEVQNRLGHTDVKTTMDIYTHLSDEVKDITINKFKNYLNI